MSQGMFLWSLVNLADGEAEWFLSLVLTLAFVAVATHFIKQVLDKLHQKFLHSGQVFKDAAVVALYQPLNFYIWFVTLASCIDLVSDRLFSELFTGELRVFFKVGAVLMIAWFLVRLKKNMITLLLNKSRSNEISLKAGQVYGVSKLATLIISVIVILLLMEATGLNVNTIIAFGGISGLAIAFASQEIIANFFGGLMIHINQTVSVGEKIQLPSSDVNGEVQDIGWYQTKLLTSEQLPLYVPNSFFTKASVINTSRRSKRAISEIIPLRVEDVKVIAKIINTLHQALSSMEGVDTKSNIIVNIASITSSSIGLRIHLNSVKVEDKAFFALRDSILLKAVEIIKEAGADITQPQEVLVKMHSS